MFDDDFEPKLGRIRARPPKAPRSYVQKVLRAASLAGGGKPARGHFTGARIGRGAVAGRQLGIRDRSGLRHRRVVVKYRLTPIRNAKGLDAARAHLRYIQRDGVTREGEPGQLYAADSDRADGRAFLERADGDRHQFRFIVSPEDGDQYDDLKPLTRRLMTQMEQDLGTKLDWVAVDHYNTGHPHTHIVVRGRNDRGQDLVIAPDYLTRGLRERAIELVSLDLGPRTAQEIEEQLSRDVGQERLTSIDRDFLREHDADHIVSAAALDPFRQSVRAGRLQKLAQLGLAEEAEPGRWRLSGDMEATLRAMGTRGDIIRTMQQAFAKRDLDRAAFDYAVADPATMTPIVGRLVDRGLSDELNDRHYLIVDGTDGRSHYVEIGKGDATPFLPHGSVLRIAPRSTEPRAADRTVAEIAAAHGGRYSIDIHLRHDRGATQTFAETHVRRLEAIRRAMGNVEREPDGTWIIAPDHIERAAAFEARRARAAPMTIDTLSAIPLDRQLATEGATWLDRELASGGSEALRDAGFGREVRDALDRRRQWLIAEGLAQEEQGRVMMRANLLGVLRQRELNRAAGQLSDELGLDYAEARSGERIDGIYRRPVDLASGRFALVERSRDFTLVPWRPVLDRHIDKPVSGIMRGDAINWTIGRERSGPSIS
ncbi:type IV secretory pathway VirD2 relaxase [Sphingomonas sp. SORGH_AS 950]|uniref:relaxase/mobilization nuclease RlxS n=1 Tax=Sphingomonas sp. SORGH_AS_0950 TaxID=3041792 RepID=UPI0027875F10|nr:relaxase/mobilization nuclease RlxS [Sphingomonas sp. SORGH_AS_0950]MDQ1158920.1 type IV secretory pathway VirD2 relaxase [Sphingomonas sp. SORGH_AS_0950]